MHSLFTTDHFFELGTRRAKVTVLCTYPLMLLIRKVLDIFVALLIFKGLRRVVHPLNFPQPTDIHQLYWRYSISIAMIIQRLYLRYSITVSTPSKSNNIFVKFNNCVARIQSSSTVVLMLFKSRIDNLFNVCTDDIQYLYWCYSVKILMLLMTTQ